MFFKFKKGDCMFQFDEDRTLLIGGVMERINGEEYKGFIGNFLGSFEKGVHQEFPPKCDKKLYGKAEKDIIAILGKKEKYTLEEVVHYFQKKYGAYRVPFAYSTWYEDAIYQEAFDPIYAWFQTNEIEDIDGECEIKYIDMREKTGITLVIDTVYNEQLRKKYPDIAKLEKLIVQSRRQSAEEYLQYSQDEKLDAEHREEAYNRYQKRLEKLKNNPSGHRNVIVHIGSVLGQIATMFTCNTFYSYEEKYNTPLMELQYEIWFFFQHH